MTAATHSITRETLVPTTRSLRRQQVRVAQTQGQGGQQPIAAVRLSAAVLPGVTAGLHQAGFAVLDINAHEVGPRPDVLVLELPDEQEAARRLLATSGNGAGRLFVTQAQDTLVATKAASHEEIVQVPCHPLQIAAAVLRAGRAPEHVLRDWATRMFDA